MLEVTTLRFEDLKEEEKKNVSNNGSGMEYATYLKVTHNGKTILLESDAMEPEDATLDRDLRWVKDIINKVYVLGKSEK